MNRKIGLVIASRPRHGRLSRDQLDVALAAASLGLGLELFFTSEGIAQLLGSRDGHKGWQALPTLTSVEAWAAEETLLFRDAALADLRLEVKVATATEMAERLAGCDQVMVI